MCEIVLTAKHSVLRFIPPPFRGRHDLASFHAPNVVCNVSIVSNVRVTLKNTDTMPHRCQHLFQDNQQGLDSHVGLAKLRYANTLPSESIGNALWANSAGRTVGRKIQLPGSPSQVVFAGYTRLPQLCALLVRLLATGQGTGQGTPDTWPFSGTGAFALQTTDECYT